MKTPKKNTPTNQQTSRPPREPQQGESEPAQSELPSSTGLPAIGNTQQLRQRALLQMQRRQGNTVVQRHLNPKNQALQRETLSDVENTLQRDPLTDALDWAGDRLGDLTDTRQDEARLDAEEDLADFMSQDFELDNHHPSTGRGLFDAKYTPASGDLTITVKICFKFLNGNQADPQWVAAVGGPANAATYSADQFQWEDDEKDQWKSNAISQVQSLWSERYVFHSTRQYWDNLPSVNVHARVQEAPESGEGAAHFVTNVRKWPTDGGKLTESVTPPAAGSDQSTARFQVSSEDGVDTLDERHFTRTTRTRNAYNIVDTKNPGQVFFAKGSSDVSGDDKNKLKEFGEALGQAEIPPFPVTLTGRASAEGEEDKNLDLASDRALNVSNEIVSAGAKTQPTVDPKGEEGADRTARWRRVDVTVGAFESDQRTVLHEFGHMFGLGDEYPTADSTPPSSRPPGTEVAHSDLAETLIPGQEPIVAHHNENIMSNGEVVQPHHYVTFLEALGTMSNTTGEWDVGPATPHGPGDFPAPSGDTAHA